MVLNRGIKHMDDGEPMSPKTGDDPFVFGTPTVGGPNRVTVFFTDRDGERHRVVGEVIRFDTWSSHHGFGGHNILVETDDDWVQAQDAEDDRIRIRTRLSGESEVLINRPGAGMNTTVARSDSPDDIQVYAGDVGGDD